MMRRAPAGMGFAGPGHAVFAATVAALGVVGLIQGDFTPTWSGVPNGFPGRLGIAWLCALVSLVSGIGLLWPRAARAASWLLLGTFVAWMLVFRVSRIFVAPKVLDTWWACGDTAVMTAAAWVISSWLAGDRERGRLRFATGDAGLRLARALYGLALIPFGVAHFTNLGDTAPLVPAWIPWHVAWAYLTGAAFIAAGVAVMTGVCARLAATLSLLQMGLFTILVWGPTLVAGPNAFQWSEFIDSWALTAGAWVVADSYRGMPWVRRRGDSAGET